jgi:hypothetical protein
MGEDCEDLRLYMRSKQLLQENVNDDAWALQYFSDLKKDSTWYLPYKQTV